MFISRPRVQLNGLPTYSEERIAALDARIAQIDGYLQLVLERAQHWSARCERFARHLGDGATSDPVSRELLARQQLFLKTLWVRCVYSCSPPVLLYASLCALRAEDHRARQAGNRGAANRQGTLPNLPPASSSSSSSASLEARCSCSCSSRHLLLLVLLVLLYERASTRSALMPCASLPVPVPLPVAVVHAFQLSVACCALSHW